MDTLSNVGIVAMLFPLLGIVVAVFCWALDVWLQTRKTKPMKTTIEWNTHGASLSDPDTPKG